MYLCILDQAGGAGYTKTLKPIEKSSSSSSNLSVQNMIDTDFAVIQAYDPIIAKMERDIIRMANHYDPVAYALLKSIHGIGRIPGLVILYYEIENINRFPSVQDFASYAWLVKCAKESNGKRYGTIGKKIGNAHLKNQ